MLKGDRMGFRRIAADLENGARIVDVVVGIRHRAVAPGVRDTCDRGRVANPRLVVTVVGAPEGVELAEEIGLLVVVLGRAQPIDGIGARGFADLEHLVADLGDGVFPGDLLPLTVDHLGRVFQAAFAMRVLAHRRALGTVGAEVEGAVPTGFLTRPDPVLHLSDDRAADRTVRADRFDEGDFTTRTGGCLRLLDHSRRDGGESRGTTRSKPRAPEERPAIHCTADDARQRLGQTGAIRNPIRLLGKH